MLTTARTRFLAVSAGLLVFASPQSQATNYSVIDLGTVTPAGVNNHGQVAVQQGLWSGGVLVPMAPFIAPVEPSGGDALDINDAGQILGHASYQIAGPCQSTNGGFRLSVVTDGALACAPGYVSQFPGRMNSAGKVAYYTWVVDPFGFVWDSQTGTNTQLAAGPPGPNSSIYQVATDINDLGDVVGSSNPPSAIGGLSRAVRWQGPVVTDLGIVGQAVAVGNGGQVAVNGGYLWDGGVLTNMGAFTPRDLNSSVNVVGSQQVAGAPHAVAWQGGVLADLNDLIPPASGWVLQSAARISDNGYIVGTGTLGGQSHGFLLVPDTITPAQADLTVTATVSPPGGGVIPGAMTVTFTVTNNGPATATGVNLIHNYRPYQYSFGPITTLSQGSCRTNAWSDQNTNNPTAYAWCALGGLPPGGSATVQLSTYSVVSNTTLNASAHAIELDANPGDNQVSQAVPQFSSTARADLSVSVSDAPDPAQIGQPVTYTATVTNNGPDIAALVSLQSSAPAGTTNVSATPSVGTCTVSSSFVNCSVGDLAAGGSAFVQVVAIPAAAGAVSRGFSSYSPVPDPNNSNNGAVAVTAVPGVADLALTMTGPSQGIQGSYVNYSIVVTNNGPDPVGNVAATGTLTTCNFGTLAAGATVSCTRTDQLRGPPYYPATATHTMTVAPSAGVTDPNPGNNTATVSTTVLPNQADVVLTMTDSPDPAVVGNTVTYSITLTNNGPAPTSSVTVSGSLPTCLFGGVPANQSVTCVRTALASAVGTLTQNMAVTAASPTDPNTGNNSASASTTVLGIADLSLAMTDSPDPAVQGDTVTYTITVSNTGPDPVTNVTVTGSLPACSLGTIAAGGSASCVRTVTASVAGTLTQSMSVSATESDPNPANNGASASTTVQAGADLAVTMTDSPDPVKKGSRLTYTIVVSNAGPQGATGVGLGVVLPANITFESRTTSQGSCSGTATVSCALGSIGNGSSATVTIKIKPRSTGTATSTASVTGSPADPNGANNSATATTTVKK